MREYSLLIFATALFVSTSTGYAQEAGGAAQAARRAAANSDNSALVTTLNLALEENKKLRGQMNQVQQLYAQEATENNALRTQLLTIGEQTNIAIQNEREKMSEFEETVEELKLSVDRYREETEQAQAEKSQIMDRIEEVNVENNKLKRFLGFATQEGEADVYLRELEGIHETNIHTVTPISEEKLQEKINTELGELYYSLGNMLFEARDYKTAADRFQKAVDFNPNDAWAHHNLGILKDYYLSDTATARYHYSRFIQLAPHDDDADHIRERLLELQLRDNVIPDDEPLRGEFHKYHKRGK